MHFVTFSLIIDLFEIPNKHSLFLPSPSNDQILTNQRWTWDVCYPQRDYWAIKHNCYTVLFDVCHIYVQILASLFQGCVTRTSYLMCLCLSCLICQSECLNLLFCIKTFSPQFCWMATWAGFSWESLLPGLAQLISNEAYSFLQSAAGWDISVLLHILSFSSRLAWAHSHAQSSKSSKKWEALMHTCFSSLCLYLVC